MKIDEIIAQEYVYPVFQPVVSLKTAEVYGYEVLSRIENREYAKDSVITDLFRCAAESGRLWDLEKICRKKALKTARAFGISGKLFLKTSSRILNDPSFSGGYTMKKLEKYGIDLDRIVFELNEGLCAQDITSLKEMYDHYGAQNFHVSIDNTGANYTEMLCSLNPDYIKIAMNITRGISSDELKQSIVKNLVQFCSGTGTILIAQGIETADELGALIACGVPYGEGFFIGMPALRPGKAEKQACSVIFKTHTAEKEKKPAAPVIRKMPVAETGSSRPAGTLAVSGWITAPGTPASDILALFQKENTCTLVSVVTEKGKIEGCILRSHLLSSFGSRYGYSLYSRKTVRDVMETDFLCVDCSETIEQVSLKATSRDEDHIYTPVIVASKGRYAGIVTIQNLLDTIINVEVKERTQEIARKNKMLQEHQLRAERDMKMAELVQKSFYPSRAPQTPLWDCAFCFRPMSSVSGDVYDFYSSPDGTLDGVSLFDVSGHGVASGLIGILAKYLASNVFRSEKDKPLGTVMTDINSILIREKGSVENYVTGITLRFSGQKIEYVNAGHTDVLIKTPAGTVSILGGQNGDFRGRFLGVSDLPCTCTSVCADAPSGSFLLLFTDCLTESRNLAGDELGGERLAEIFSRAPLAAAEEALDFILDIFGAFTEAVPLRDDLTVIVLRKK